jgi:hypothetical protein
MFEACAPDLPGTRNIAQGTHDLPIACIPGALSVHATSGASHWLSHIIKELSWEDNVDEKRTLRLYASAGAECGT